MHARFRIAFLAASIGCVAGGGCKPAPDAGMPVACDALFDAQITAAARCESTTLAHDVAGTMRVRFRASCLDLHALHGSLVSSDQVLACARATLGVACGDVRTPSACVSVAGTLRDGEACGASAQCASRACGFSSSDANCGVCKPVKSVGATCLIDGSACAEGSDCVAGVCVADGARDLAAACNRTPTCKPGLICKQGSCVAPGALGAACQRTSDCTEGTVCAGGQCAAGILAGGDCQVSPEGCARGLLCDGAVCSRMTLVGPGLPCGASARQACAIGHCDASSRAAEGMCPALIEDGKPCGATSGGSCDYLARCIGGVCLRQGGETCR